MKDPLEQLKKDYLDEEIPEELDFVVKKAIQEGKKQAKKKKNTFVLKTVASFAAAAMIMFTVSINTSTALAQALIDIPVVGNVVKVLTFNEIIVDKDGYNASLETPVLEGLTNEGLQESLNAQYLEENKKLYEEFMLEVKALEENGGGHLGLDSGYVIKTDTDQLLAVGRYVVNTVASSSTVFKYDTIDKQKEILITLPSLFKDHSYVEVISENIKKQMIEQNKLDENKFYWVEGIEQETTIDLFNQIAADQSFYINENNQLVISFDKYEVAPGYMGVVEFVIPTESLTNVLVSDEYIK